MSSSAVGGAWHQAYNEMTGGDGYAGGEGYSGAGGMSGCSECNSGRMCDCARSCAAVCKKKAKEKIQCAYAIGFAVCLVFVLFIWMMWPMIGSAVSAFSSKHPAPAHPAGFQQKGPFSSQPPQPSPYSAHQASPFAAAPSTATSGAYAAPHPPQYMPCRSWLDQGLPLTQASGYLNGVDNEPGATNGRQMGGKYRGAMDHPGADVNGFDQAPPMTLHTDPSAPAHAPEPVHTQSKFGSLDRSLFSGSRFSSNRFIGGTSAQYPSEWATPGRDEDVTEMTLRCAAQHQYGDVPTALPAAPAAPAAAAPAASHFGGIDKRF